MDALTKSAAVPGTDLSFGGWMADRAARIERALDAKLPAPDAHPTRLHQAMRYAVLGVASGSGRCWCMARAN